MLKLLKKFEGKKTYMVLGAAFVVLLVGDLSLVSPDFVKSALEILGVLGLGTMADKINRVVKVVKEKK